MAVIYGHNLVLDNRNRLSIKLLNVETYLKQITYYKVNVSGLRLRLEVTAIVWYGYSQIVTGYGCSLHWTLSPRPLVEQ